MRIKVLFATLLVSLLAAATLQAQIRGLRQTELTDWKFSIDGSDWEDVIIPHSYNAKDGRTASYYRGEAVYRADFRIVDPQATHYLVFEGAAQKAIVKINGVEVAEHKGGYTSFPVNISNAVRKGLNEVEVVCDNSLDLDMIPISSDFNKNGGLHGQVYLVQQERAFFSSEDNGLYRFKFETPVVTPKKVQTVVSTKVLNNGNKDMTVNVRLQLVDAEGRLGYQADRKIDLSAYSEYDFEHEFTVAGLHFWDGVNDPYLYTMRLELFQGKRILDITEAKVGYRSMSVDPEKGFMLNGKPYPLRGVAIHQDMEGKASAMGKEDYRRDYGMVKEIGANFVRMAHYPHNDFAFQLADSLGLIVQTEIPWVNVCGVKASEDYFDNIKDQMGEMIRNLYNHPCVAFWGIWNELGLGGNDGFQGEFDAEAAVYRTGKLYEYAKSLDPCRFVGVSDCTLMDKPGFKDMKVDYVSENRYNGWYYDFDDFNAFTCDMKAVHDKMGVTNVSEYGVGVNPYCHEWDSSKFVRDRSDAKHSEEYGNLFHESYVRQIKAMPWLNFTSVWVMFDFAVSGRKEGYLDSDNGETFTDNPERYSLNDKGLVTRDRKLRKDSFYLYKSLWNKDETTVRFTSSRRKHFPAGEDLRLKVYSNAKTLTLYQNGVMVQKMMGSGESTGVIWEFPALRLKTESDTFKVVSENGVQDEVTISRLR